MTLKKTGVLNALIIGVSSYEGHSVTFTILIEKNGALWGYIPIDALFVRNVEPSSPQFSYKSLVYHNCPDENFVQITYSYFEGKEVTCWIKTEEGLTLLSGTYISSFDWPDGNISQNFVSLENGQFAIVPNHKLLVGKQDELPVAYKKLRQEWI